MLKKIIKKVFGKKPLEHVCGTCRLFNPELKRCGVVILHEGEKYNLPVDAEDKCFFEQEFHNTETGEMENFNEIKEIRMWVENEKGEKDSQGKVKIQIPIELDYFSDFN